MLILHAALISAALAAPPAVEIAQLKKRIEANEAQISMLGKKLITTPVTDGYPDTLCHKCGELQKECERANLDAEHDCFGQCAVADMGETGCVAVYRSQGCYEKVVKGGGAGAEEGKARRARIKAVDSCWRVRSLKRIEALKDENLDLRARLAEFEAKRAANAASRKAGAAATRTSVVVPAR
jgi:hypothetical protein